MNPNPTFNGSFAFFGSETGSDFADFLIGVPSNYNQADSQAYYARHKYAAAFLQDSWRVRPSLTLNYGIRWDLMQYWSEKYNQIPTFVLGQQSKVYPTAPPTLVYPTDAGVPNTLVPQAQPLFSRGWAWPIRPQVSDGFWGKIFGGPGKTSIRAGFGIFYSVIQGNTIAIDEPQPPYGLSYTSPGSPLFATPFITAADGTVHVQPFPLTFPPLNATVNHPNPNIDFSPFLPQAGMTAPPPSNTYPYNENYFLSIERQVGKNTLLSVVYAGSQAHHLLVVASANPGNPALCLALSDPSAVAPGTTTCGPFGEDATYITAAGKVLNGTRGPMGSNFTNDDLELSIGNSNYNSLQASLRHTSDELRFFNRVYVQQVDRHGIEHFRSGQSVQLSRDARAVGLRFDAQLGGDLRLSASIRPPLPRPEGFDGRLVDFRNHAYQHRFSGDDFERRRQLADGKPSQRRKQQESGSARLCFGRSQLESQSAQRAVLFQYVAL